jgi:thiol-disulfide isomerase/thioredoxin
MMRPTLAFLLVLPLFIGCGPLGGRGGGGGDGDSDGDLLSDSFEIQIGTDPDDPDSDGDGYTDGEEHFTFFSPRNVDDFPYVGGYARGPLWRGSSWDELSEDDGWGQGDFTKSWTTVDQHGQEIKLKRFYGQVILIDVSAEWCPPCRDAAQTLEAEYQDRVGDGFVILQLVLDGLNPANAPNLDRWADEFGLTLPLIDGHDYDVVAHYVPANSEWAIPNYTIIDREHEIVNWYQAGGTANFTLVDSLLDEEVPEVDYPWPDDVDDIRDELGIVEGDWIHPFDAR